MQGLAASQLGAELDVPAAPAVPGRAIETRRERHRTREGTPIEVEVSRRKICLGEHDALLCLCLENKSPGLLDKRPGGGDLEAITRELDAFTYAVSHDFRAPLRSIRGFSEALLERNGGQLDERGRDYLQRVCESSKHINQLIEGLLKLSRLSRAELRLQEVNLSNLASAVAADLRKAEPQREVAIEIEPGLAAYGDERLLRSLLEQLLQNAWKFTSPQPLARVEFARAPGVEPPAFMVRDNGVGFDMQYSSKLFGVFQRLHSPAEFPGIGIGLATVQRIINRHGGRIWAEAAIGRGAAFFFTLPPPVNL